MPQDQQKVIFLICDDEEKYRECNAFVVVGELERKFSSAVPHEMHFFENGAGSLRFLKEKGNAAGVVLISDYDMPKVDGRTLFRELSRLNLLPENSFMCSRISPDLFQQLVIRELSAGDTEKKIQLIPKDNLGRMFAKYLPAAIQNAAKEIGLDVALRPERQPRTDGHKPGAKPR